MQTALSTELTSAGPRPHFIATSRTTMSSNIEAVSTRNCTCSGHNAKAIASTPPTLAKYPPTRLYDEMRTKLLPAVDCIHGQRPWVHSDRSSYELLMRGDSERVHDRGIR